MSEPDVQLNHRLLCLIPSCLNQLLSRSERHFAAAIAQKATPKRRYETKDLVRLLSGSETACT